MTETTAVKFGTVAAVIAHFEAVESDTLNKEEVLEALKSVTTKSGKSGERRGQLAGLKLEDMSLEQLKREKINASSVLYKAQQRGASEETIAKNQARVDAVTARLAELQPAPAAEEATTENVETNADVEAEL